MIFDADGAAGADLKYGISAVRLGLLCCSGIEADSGCHQAGNRARRAFLTITRLAKANRVCSCAVFLARPR